MSMPIDPATPNVHSRQGAVYSASLNGGEKQAAEGLPLNGARRVEPIEGSEKGQATDDGRLREGRREDVREHSSPDSDGPSKPEAAANTYDRKFSYDADMNRVYLDIVNTIDDEVLMRLPSESTAKYLEQITLQSDAKDDAEPASRIREIV